MWKKRIQSRLFALHILTALVTSLLLPGCSSGKSAANRYPTTAGTTGSTDAYSGSSTITWATTGGRSQSGGGDAGSVSANGGVGNSGGAISTSDLALPAPRLGDDSHPVPKALSQRRSTRAFSTAQLSMTQQSEIVWSAFGVNRPGDGKRTAPSAYNCQDIDLLLLTSSGVFAYNATGHALTLRSTSDLRGQLGTTYATAPLTIVYVSNQDRIRGSDKVTYGYMHTGLIGTNVYLYAAYESLPVVIRSDTPSGLSRSLNLTNSQVITLVQTIGLAEGQTNASGTAFKEGSLIAPRTTSHPILKALLNRKSATGYASTALSEQVLGEVLWSGFGVNRAGGHRTAPSAFNCQDVDIYVALASGAYRYDAPSHALRKVANTDLRSTIDASNASAPLMLVFVSNYAKISNTADQARYSAAHTGFIAQNVSVYAASENLAAKVYEGIGDNDSVRTALQLTSTQHIKLYQTVGVQP